MKILGVNISREKRSNLANPAQWLADLFGSTTSSGTDVDEHSALAMTAVWSCVRLISETFATLPVTVNRREDGRRIELFDHPARQVLTVPNKEMTSIVYRETLQAHMLTWGNGYSAIVRGSNGVDLLELIPLPPDTTYPKRNDAGNIVYVTCGLNSQVTLNAEDVLHIPALGFNGLIGYSPIAKHRESIGLGLASQEFGARFFGNGAAPMGVLEHPMTIDNDVAKRLRTQWNEMHQGLENSSNTAILEEGMTYKPIGLPNKDSQFIETRKFQVTEIARIFRVPPHMIADLDKSSFSNITEQSLEFVKYTMLPWLIRWEQELARKLLTEGEKRAGVYFKFNIDALLRGDFKTRVEGYHIGWQDGWLSANEIRAKEDLNPIEDGDSYFVPMNMQMIGDVGKDDEVRAAAIQRIALKEQKQFQAAVEENAEDPADWVPWFANFNNKHIAFVRNVMGWNEEKATRYVDGVVAELKTLPLDTLRTEFNDWAITHTGYIERFHNE